MDLMLERADLAWKLGEPQQPVSKLVYLGDFYFQELAVRPSDTSKFLESFQ